MEQHHHHMSQEDWAAVQRHADFQQLVGAKRRFIVPATIFFIAYYFALPILVGYRPDLMSKPVFGHVNLAYLFALSEFAMAWLVMALYLRRARTFDAMERALVEKERAEFQ